MSEMVERLARAICESTEADIFDELSQRFRAVYIQQARAAIEAMREIPDEMARHIPYSPVISPWGAWENIINEALGEVKTVTGITDAALGDG